jgi:hypothetical protein
MRCIELVEVISSQRNMITLRYVPKTTKLLQLILPGDTLCKKFCDLRRINSGVIIPTLKTITVFG